MENILSKKRTKGVIAAVAILLLGFFLFNTFARYLSTASGGGDVEVARWAVKVNKTDLANGVTDFGDLVFTPDPSETVAGGKIAPGHTAKADLLVDAVGTEVAIDYALDIDLSQLSADASADLHISGVKYVIGEMVAGEFVADAGAPVTIAPNAEDKYVGTIALPTDGEGNRIAINKVYNLIIEVSWEEGTAFDVEPDADDTLKGEEAATIRVPASIELKQKLN
ncbi:hypothetical protein [Treponema sp. R6D11]